MDLSYTQHLNLLFPDLQLHLIHIYKLFQITSYESYGENISLYLIYMQVNMQMPQAFWGEKHHMCGCTIQSI